MDLVWLRARRIIISIIVIGTELELDVTLRQLAQGKLLSHLILRCWQRTQARMRGGLFGTLAGVGVLAGAAGIEDVVEAAFAEESVDAESGG